MCLFVSATRSLATKGSLLSQTKQRFLKTIPLLDPRNNKRTVYSVCYCLEACVLYFLSKFLIFELGLTGMYYVTCPICYIIVLAV